MAVDSSLVLFSSKNAVDDPKTLRELNAAAWSQLPWWMIQVSYWQQYTSSWHSRQLIPICLATYSWWLLLSSWSSLARIFFLECNAFCGLFARKVYFTWSIKDYLAMWCSHLTALFCIQLFNSVNIGMIFSQLFMTMHLCSIFSCSLDRKTAEGVRQGGGTSESN
jgi:hypothetical protein